MPYFHYCVAASPIGPATGHGNGSIRDGEDDEAGDRGAVAKPANGGTAPALSTGYRQLALLGRANFALMLRANAALSEGLEAIGQEVMLHARRSFEQAAETATALLGAKSVEDVLELNAEFAKAHLQGLLEGSAKLSEIGVRIASEALAPLGGRFAAPVRAPSRPDAA